MSIFFFSFYSEVSQTKVRSYRIASFSFRLYFDTNNSQANRHKGAFSIAYYTLNKHKFSSIVLHP